MTETIEVPQSADEERLRAEVEAARTRKSATFDELFGIGKDLWDSDEEFEQFLEFIQRSRKDHGHP